MSPEAADVYMGTCVSCTSAASPAGDNSASFTSNFLGSCCSRITLKQSTIHRPLSIGRLKSSETIFCGLNR